MTADETPPDASGASTAEVPFPYQPPGKSAAPFDPLRLCIFATIAALSWALGPFALLFFAGLGITGYVKARRAGLLNSRCLLGDTRIVIGYLGLLAAAAVVGIVLVVQRFL